VTALPQGDWADIGQGHRIHFHEQGSGDPVLFFHGSGPGASGLSNFAGSMAPLAQAGLRALAPDLLGYGLSSKPVDQPYLLENHADAMVRFADALGLARFSIVGNSLGGAIAMQVALDHPDRVDRLVLMAPGGLETKERYMEMRGIRRMLRMIYGPEGITLAGMEKVFSLQVHDPALVPHDVIAARTKVALTQPRHVFETLRVTNLAPRLSEITQPTLALWGREDQFCPVSGAWTLSQGIANARVVILPHCGHWVMVEWQALFNREISRFLAPKNTN
jgi:4,5:9,10-diseco-3-hydroxy-5,9,17-trioxoandrosta-1(10),2-diene-4-oate hydrolase